MTNNSNGEEIKINLGCGGRPLIGYVNVDMDTIEELKSRYPDTFFPPDLKVYQYDIFNLPYSDNSVSEIKSDSMLEHLSFKEEKMFFLEVRRVLKPGGLLIFSVPDFEETVKVWLNANDNWKDFYRDDEEAILTQHWFGQYSYSMDSRWGYLIASIFGPQNSPGQFHKNAYTIGKIRAILSKLEFEEEDISHFLWKGDRDKMILVKARKK